jgi:rSAM/selenodomain-associated transferase 2
MARISIIIPTLNEQSVIGPLLASLADWGADELLVADGGSRDRTVDVAARHARIVHSDTGRAAQMNAGARCASGDVLLFLHADARLGAKALAAVRRVMADPVIAGGNFDIQYDGKDWAAAAFTRINRWRRQCGIFYGDSGIFCRRTIFQSLGGFACWPIMEDYEFARRLRRAGRLAYLDEPIWVSDRRWRKGGLVPTLASWFFIQSLYSAGVPPKHLARLYRHIR